MKIGETAMHNGVACTIVAYTIDMSGQRYYDLQEPGGKIHRTVELHGAYV